MFSCSTPPPTHELCLTDSALKAAKRLDAGKYSPDKMRKAELFYRYGRKLYRSKNYDKAKSYLKRSRIFAEKAEEKALLKGAMPIDATTEK